MVDILVDSDRDFEITEDGDIEIETSIPPDIVTHLLWIESEWRLGPDFGFPWFEEMLVKKPNIDLIIQRIRDEILEVDGVEECTVQLLSFDKAKRYIRFEYFVTADGETYNEEVELNV